jgi:hypothetical protein
MRRNESLQIDSYCDDGGCRFGSLIPVLAGQARCYDISLLELKRTIAPKALARFKARIREITRRAKGVSLETTIAELAPYMRGWSSSFDQAAGESRTA